MTKIVGIEVNPCLYCQKTDRLRLESAWEKRLGQTDKFYRVRCTRMICRLRGKRNHDDLSWPNPRLAVKMWNEKRPLDKWEECGEDDDDSIEDKCNRCRNTMRKERMTAVYILDRSIPGQAVPREYYYCRYCAMVMSHAMFIVNNGEYKGNTGEETKIGSYIPSTETDDPLINIGLKKGEKE